jgi:hypothetical protein
MITISYNYSSSDIEFLEENLCQAAKITDDIQISYVNKFFDGKDENLELIKLTKQIALGKCQLNEINFNPCAETQIGDQKMAFKYWHNITRFNNTQKSKYDYVLYLDGDETIDGDGFKEFISSIDINQYNSYIFNVYWYFRSKKFQAKFWEEGPVMANKNILNYNDFMSVHERWNLLKNPCARDVKSLNQKPLIHHYSWAKGNSDKECKSKLLHKTQSWGHSSERDWNGMIEEEFSRPFNGTDFIHNYSYNILT